MEFSDDWEVLEWSVQTDGRLAVKSGVIEDRDEGWKEIKSSNGGVLILI